MELLRWKARLSVLWIFMAVLMSATMILYLIMPGVLEEVIAGEMGGMQITEGLLLFSAILWLIPLIMAVLCLTLKDSCNRWLNFVLGILFGLGYIFDMINHLTKGEMFFTHLLMCLASVVVAAFIAWFAWKLPKQEA